MRSVWLGGAVALALTAFAQPASAYCRTTSGGLRSNCRIAANQCCSQGVPLYWKNACVSFSMQKDASVQVPLEDARSALALAFSKWTHASCGSGIPSIEIHQTDDVACSKVEYTQDAGNQNVIVFRDTVWEHSDSNNTLALTTMTFNPDSGEIYDADMEINTADTQVTLRDPVPATGYDFASIVTHEVGHFLGLAHSGDLSATMFAQYKKGNTAMRSLTPDDAAGICSAYEPGGNRVTGSGDLPAEACDPTPRHGFSDTCASDKPATRRSGSGEDGGCAVAPVPSPAVPGQLVACAGLAGCALLLRRAGRVRQARRRHGDTPVETDT